MASGTSRDDYIYIYVDAAVVWPLVPLGMTIYIYVYAAVVWPLVPLGMTIYLEWAKSTVTVKYIMQSVNCSPMHVYIYIYIYIYNDT